MHPILITALLMVLCTLLVAATTLIAKALGNGALGETLHPLMVSQARFVFGMLSVMIVLALMRLRGRALWPASAPPQWGMHALRSGLGWASNVLIFAAVAHMALTDANALSFLSPFVTMLIAIALLGERPGRWRWLAAAMAMVGAVILLRPGAGVFQPAALLALSAAITMGAEAVVIKRLAMTEPVARTMLINNTMGAAIATVAALPVLLMPGALPATLPMWSAMAALGAIMVTAQVLYLAANLRGEASFVAPFWYMTLVWAGVYDGVFFDVWPDAISILGSGVIITGGLIMTWREWRARQRGMPTPGATRGVQATPATTLAAVPVAPLETPDSADDARASPLATPHRR